MRDRVTGEEREGEDEEALGKERLGEGGRWRKARRVARVLGRSRQRFN